MPSNMSSKTQIKAVLKNRAKAEAIASQLSAINNNSLANFTLELLASRRHSEALKSGLKGLYTRTEPHEANTTARCHLSFRKHFYP